MSTNFYGREAELVWLRGMFDQCAERDANGRFIGGPHMAFVIAESGIGKSRLVQELYLQLTSDERWDPPEVDYWPEAFLELGAQLCTVPDMKHHVPKGPPRFAWLGARWQSPDVRNVQERRSVLPSLRSSVMVHAEILNAHRSAWDDAAGRIVHSVKKEGVGETFSAIADFTGVPFLGLLTKLVKGTKDLVQDRLVGPRNFAQVEAEELKSEVDEVLDCMRLLLHCKSAVPTVLWLDDAQWIDAETGAFVQKLWAEAERRKWPLLIVVTHWEREWRELAHAPSDSNEQSQLRAFEGTHGVDCLHLTKAGSIELDLCLSQRLPGLTASQRTLLVEKAAGNFLTMIENIAELRSEPMWFANERFDGVLTTAAVDHISKFETDRERRVRQRFQAFTAEVKKVLGWSTQLGVRFLSEVVADFVGENLKHPDPAALLEQCVDPLVVLGKPSELTREFRDKVFHQVASEYRGKFLQRDETRLSQILRTHLIEWVNNSFDVEGTGMWDSNDEGAAPSARSAMSLDESERREFLEIAMRELPLPEDLDWSDPRTVAALRAVCLLVFTDRRDGLWSRVATLLRGLEGVDWNVVPIQVVSLIVRSQLCDFAQTAGTLRSASNLARSLVDWMRVFAEGDSNAFSSISLLISLNLHGNTLLPLGLIADAQECFEESLEIARRTLSTEGTLAQRLRVSQCIDSVGDVLELRGLTADARRCFEESLEIRRSLVLEDSTPERRRYVGFSLSRLGSSIALCGSPADALKYQEEGIAIQRVVLLEEDTRTHRSDLAESLARIGDSFASLARTTEAQPFYEESLELRRRLLIDEDTPERRRAVGLSLNRIGDILQSQGLTAEALSCHQESLELQLRSRLEEPTRECRRDISLSLCAIGDIVAADGLADDAQKYYTESLELARSVVSELDSPRHRCDLSRILNRFGGFLALRGRPVDAQRCWEESLELARGLLLNDSTPERRRDLSVNLDNVGQLILSCGLASEALSYFEESLDIRRCLLRQEDTPRHRDDVFESLMHGRDCAVGSGAFARGRELAEECWNTVRDLVGESQKPAASEILLSFLLTLIFCEIELQQVEDANESATAIEVLVTALEAALNDEPNFSGDPRLVPTTLRSCANGLELVARAHALQGDSVGASAAVCRASVLRTRADELEVEDHA